MRPPELTGVAAEGSDAANTRETNRIVATSPDAAHLAGRGLLSAGILMARLLIRRRVMRGALLAACAVAVSAVPLAGCAPAVAAPPAAQATGVVRLFSGYFRAKTEANVDRTMSYFSRTKLAYIDGTVGLANYSWHSQYDTFAEFMPHWPAGSWSYPSRIIGDTRSAVVFYTDSAGLFGPNEIRAVGVVNFEGGKVVRWIDYWDGRQFGLTNYDALKVPASKFPTNFATDTVGEAKSLRLEGVLHGLARALRAEEYAKAASYFASDAVLTDYPSHVVITGRHGIDEFLSGAGTLLPYVGSGTTVRHAVGDSAGGAYEWTAKGAVPRGVCAIELDAQGKISRMYAMWNGALVGVDTLHQLARAAARH